MYCPKCFNDSLYIKPKGVVHLIINGKQMDAGRFLFNQDESKKEYIVDDFTLKIREFFSWYSNFQNKQPIEVVEICTGDVKCESGCHIDLNLKFSVIGDILPRKVVSDIMDKMSKKYNIKTELKI